MKKLIRAKNTKRFLTRDERWTESFTKAWSFTDISQMETALAKLQVLDVEIYYSFGDDEPCEWDFALPSFAGNTPEAGLERCAKGRFRILLRRPEGPKYLQPSGDWRESRESAREFASSVLAYCWAKEQQLLGIDVLMAHPDPNKDVVTMRL